MNRKSIKILATLIVIVMIIMNLPLYVFADNEVVPPTNTEVTDVVVTAEKIVPSDVYKTGVAPNRDNVVANAAKIRSVDTIVNGTDVIVNVEAEDGMISYNNGNIATGKWFGIILNLGVDPSTISAATYGIEAVDYDATELVHFKATPQQNDFIMWLTPERAEQKNPMVFKTADETVVASVTVNFTEVVTKATLEAGGTITLQADATINSSVTFANDTTINLNGHNIEIDGNFLAEANVTVKGEGYVKVNYPVLVSGGLTLDDARLDGSIYILAGTLDIDNGSAINPTTTTGSYARAVDLVGHLDGSIILPDTIAVLNGLANNAGAITVSIDDATINASAGLGLAVYDYGMYNQTATLTVTDDTKGTTNGTGNDAFTYKVLTGSDPVTGLEEEGLYTGGVTFTATGTENVPTAANYTATSNYIVVGNSIVSTGFRLPNGENIALAVGQSIDFDKIATANDTYKDLISIELVGDDTTAPVTAPEISTNTEENTQTGVTDEQNVIDDSSTQTVDDAIITVNQDTRKVIAGAMGTAQLRVKLAQGDDVYTEKTVNVLVLDDFESMEYVVKLDKDNNTVQEKEVRLATILGTNEEFARNTTVTLLTGNTADYDENTGKVTFTGTGVNTFKVELTGSNIDFTVTTYAYTDEAVTPDYGTSGVIAEADKEEFVASMEATIAAIMSNNEADYANITTPENITKIREAVANGTAITATITKTEINPAAPGEEYVGDIQLLNGALLSEIASGRQLKEKEKILKYYDIKVGFTVGNDTIILSELASPIKLGFDLPNYDDNFQAVDRGYSRTYSVLKVHNGKAVALKTKYFATPTDEPVDQSIDASRDQANNLNANLYSYNYRFSTFAISYYDEYVGFTAVTGEGIEPEDIVDPTMNNTTEIKAGMREGDAIDNYNYLASTINAIMNSYNSADISAEAKAEAAALIDAINGKDVRVVLQVTDGVASTTEETAAMQTELDKVLAKLSNVQGNGVIDTHNFDMVLSVQVKGTDGNYTEVTKLHELNNPITLAIALGELEVPTEGEQVVHYYVLRQHGGAIDVLPADYHPAGTERHWNSVYNQNETVDTCAYVSTESDKFSTYTLAYAVADETDTLPPVITVTDTEVEGTVGDAAPTFTATAVDNMDGDVNVTITVTPEIPVDTDNKLTTAGTYHVVYSATDRAGNEATSEKDYVVKEAGVDPEIPTRSIPILTESEGNVYSLPIGSEKPDFTTYYTAKDQDGNDVAVTVEEAVDMNTAKSYDVTFRAVDPVDQTKVAEITRTGYFTVTDNSVPPTENKPVITVEPQSDDTKWTAIAGDEKPNFGAFATAEDFEGNDITGSIQVTETPEVDMTTPGTYVIEYNVVDTYGTAADTVTRNFVVQEPDSPVITIDEDNVWEATVGDAKPTFKATATDALDGDVEVSIDDSELVVDENGKLTKATEEGEEGFTIRFTATNSHNKTTVVTRTFKVNPKGETPDPTKPTTITITPDEENVYRAKVGTEKPTFKATAKDDNGNDIDVVITDDIDMTKAGEYHVYFVAKDADNNETTETRTFVVYKEDGTNPDKPDVNPDNEGRGNTDNEGKDKDKPSGIGVDDGKKSSTVKTGDTIGKAFGILFVAIAGIGVVEFLRRKYSK